METSTYLFEVAAREYLLAPSTLRPEELEAADGVSPIGPLSHLSLDEEECHYVVFAVLERGGRYPVARGTSAECIRRANAEAARHGVPVAAKTLAAKPIHVRKQYTVIHPNPFGPSKRMLARTAELSFSNASELFDTCSSLLMTPGCPVDGGYSGPLKAPVQEAGDQVWFELGKRTSESVYAWALVAARLASLGKFPEWHQPPPEMCPRCLSRHMLETQDGGDICQECLYERV